MKKLFCNIFFVLLMLLSFENFCHSQLMNINKNEVAISDEKIDSAIQFLRDQEEDKAFRIFLNAIDIAPVTKSVVSSSEEQKLYDEALKIYLDKNEKTQNEIALELKEKYSAVIEQHPDFYLLGFFMAIADANLGNYKLFFERFYKSFLHDPNHFLVFKTKAILHLKLLEKASTEQERTSQRQLIYKNAIEGLNRYQKDPSLYKLAIEFADEREKPAIFRECLNKIFINNIVLPRTDIIFYVRQALSNNEKDLGQQLLIKAKSWYQYSRAIEDAIRILDQKHLTN